MQHNTIGQESSSRAGMSGFGGRRLGDHFLQRHSAAGEIPKSLHLREWHAVVTPLRYGGSRYTEMSGDVACAPIFPVKPSFKFHAQSLGESKPIGQANSKPELFSICLLMDNARRRRFVAYFTGKPFQGDRSKLIAKTGLTKGRVTQLFDKDEPFGERAAQQLAMRLDLPLDYFERDQDGTSASFDEETIAFAKDFFKLDAAERNRLRLLYTVASTGLHPETIKGALTGEDTSQPNDIFLGGDSGLMGLDEIPQTKAEGTRKK